MLYIFKSTKFNITNLPQYCTFLCHDDLYEPCIPHLDDMRLDVTIGKFVLDFCSTVPREMFREVNWVEQIDQLKNLVAQQHHIVFATNQLTQLSYLKDCFQDTAFTISTTWENNTRFLQWLAKFHVRMQELKLIELTEHDRDVRIQNFDIEQHYYQAFNSLGIIPESSAPCGDYNIPLDDYFDQEKFLNHLHNINGTVTTAAVDFYKSWLIKNV